MMEKIGEEKMSFLIVYSKILESCTNKLAITFLTNRIYKILSKGFKARAEADFPQVSYDLQVVNLVSYIKEGKLPYAFLYSSSIHHINIQNTSKFKEKAKRQPLGLWRRFSAYFGL